MGDRSWDEIKQQVHERAGGSCEYCRTSESNTGQTMQVDHIDPSGGNMLDNLCLSCWNCNNHKRKAIEGVDPESGERVGLYNPRSQVWSQHFEWMNDGTIIHGLSAIRRATVFRLKMNRAVIIVARQRWVVGGYHPPKQS